MKHGRRTWHFYTEGRMLRFYGKEIDNGLKLIRLAGDIEEAWELLIEYGKLLDRHHHDEPARVVSYSDRRESGLPEEQ